MKKIDELYNFWNVDSCGERHAIGDTELEKVQAQHKKRYELEPYIDDFACFKNFQNLDVLEIGVGYGADHKKIADNHPKSLCGVDLTDRAINNTRACCKIFGLDSQLKVDNAENLSFENNSFDAIYSWGVLHHSPSTSKCFDEVYRVLRPGGFAKIMIYHKHAPVGWMLWTRYALLKPFMGLNEIYSQYLESPGTKAFTVKEAKHLAKKFTNFDVNIVLSSGDLLLGDSGNRHKGYLLNIARIIYPRFLIRWLAKIFPIGLFMLITIRK